MRISLNETCLAEWQEGNLEYLRYEYDLSPGDTVIDCGAYSGEWAEAIFSRYGCKVICIEPGPWIVGFSRGQVINKAAATYDGVMKFGGNAYYTSAHEELTHEYPCFDFNALLKEQGEIALLKMNVEGAEYDLLDHVIGAGLHTAIRNLQVQFHQIEGEPYHDRYEAIQMEMAKTHRLTFCYPFVWENWRRV